ncbi:MAG: hypothetical protein AAFV86_10295 [Pseudomonadota bacterium]
MSVAVRPSQFWRRVRHAVSSPQTRQVRFARHGAMVERAEMLVMAFYAVSLMKLYVYATEYGRFTGDLAALDPMWPVLWIDLVSPVLALDLLEGASLAAGLAGVAFWQWRWARVAVSVMILQKMGFELSFGAIHHGYHEWFWISVMLCFLPSGRRPEAGVAKRAWGVSLLTVVTLCAGMILMFYTMSGVWKVLHATAQLLLGNFGGFSPEAMAVTVAKRAVETLAEPLLIEPLMWAPSAGWPLYLTLYYVEIFAVVALFRPELIRPFAMVLIFFHVGTLTLMDIPFADHVMINALFMWFLPTAVERPRARAVIAALPLIGALAALVESVLRWARPGAGAGARGASVGEGTPAE